MQNIQELTAVNPSFKSSDDHIVFYNLINDMAARKLRDLSYAERRDIILVKVNALLPEAFIDAMPEELKQEYRCNCCKQFLRGIGSFGIINEDNTVTPLVLVEDLDIVRVTDNVPQYLVDAYEAVIDAFKASKSFSALKDTDILKSDNILGNGESGGWKHLGLDHDIISRKECYEFLTSNTVKVTDHGYGKAEINALAEVIEKYSGKLPLLEKGGFKSLPPGKIKAKDLGALERFTKTLQGALIAKQQGRLTAWLYRHLILNDLVTIRFKNTAIGEAVTDYLDGGDLNAAVTKYNNLTDPASYMRPVRAPSSREFEASVKFLEENNYDVCLPMHLATFDDYLADEELIAWRRQMPKEIPKRTGIFDKQRERLEDLESISLGFKPNGVSFHEDVSAVHFINELKRRGDTIVNIRVLPLMKYFLGTGAKAQDPNAGRIYKDGSPFRTFRWVEPIYRHHFNNYMTNPDRVIDGSVDLVRYREVDGQTDISFVYRGVIWNTKINTPVFPDSLIDDLRIGHRRVIEDWCRTNYINVDLNDKVVPYQDSCASLSLGIGMIMEMTLDDGTVYTNKITSER